MPMLRKHNNQFSNPPQNELDEIFSQPAEKISAEKLDNLAGRIFSECMHKLNQQLANLDEVKMTFYTDSAHKARDKETIEANIKDLKVRYNNYLEPLQNHIVASCKDRKSVVSWLNIAARCKEVGNDMVGLAIRNALLNPGLNKYVKFILKHSKKYRALQDNYLNKFNTDDYPIRLNEMSASPISPAFPLVFSKYEQIKTKLFDCHEVLRVGKLLSNKDWNKVIPVVGAIPVGDEKQKAIIISDLKNHLQADLSKQDLEDIYALVHKYKLKNYEALARLAGKFEEYRDQQSAGNNYIEKFNQAIRNEFALTRKPLFPDYAMIKPPVQQEASHSAIRVAVPEVARRVSHKSDQVLSMSEISKLYPKIIQSLTKMDVNKKIKKSEFYKMKQTFDHDMIFLEDTNLIRQQDPKAAMQSLLVKEIKYARRVQEAIKQLKALHAHPEDINQLIRGFNQHVDGMLGEAKILNDASILREINQLVLKSYNDKEKEEEPKRLTQTWSGLFNKHPASSDKIAENILEPNDTNRPKSK